MRYSNRSGFWVWVIGTGVIIGVVCLAVGPQGLTRLIKAWHASAYGSDWLVVQYAQDGSVIAHWELKNQSVGNEEGSDGIYFPDNAGNVVHLSGHYIYLQIHDDWERARSQYLRTPVDVTLPPGIHSPVRERLEALLRRLREIESELHRLRDESARLRAQAATQ